MQFKMSFSRIALATALLGFGVGGSLPTNANAQDRGDSPVKPSQPELFRDVERQVLQHRAIEAVIWGMPTVNRDLMHQAMLRETKAKDNQML
jgi:hypothetical protein